MSEREGSGPNEDLSQALVTIYKSVQDNPGGLLACVLIFAFGLLLNVESMRRARGANVALYNREYARQQAMNYAAAGNTPDAEKWNTKAVAFDGNSDQATATALSLYRGSLVCFLLGAVAVLLIVT
jgi:hypothetical protein